MQFLDETGHAFAEFPSDLPVNYMNFLFTLEEWLKRNDVSRTRELLITADWIYLYLIDGNKPELMETLLNPLPDTISKKISLRRGQCKMMDSNDWRLYYSRGVPEFDCT